MSLCTASHLPEVIYDMIRLRVGHVSVAESVSAQVMYFGTDLSIMKLTYCSVISPMPIWISPWKTDSSALVLRDV